VLTQCRVPESAHPRMLAAALRVRERARLREPQATTDELELSLGVLLVLCGALAPAAAVREVAS
jgi:hypothetical protein